MAHSHERGISRVTFVDRSSQRNMRGLLLRGVVASARVGYLETQFHAREKGRSLKIIKIKFPSPRRAVAERPKSSLSVASRDPRALVKLALVKYTWRIGTDRYHSLRDALHRSFSDSCTHRIKDSIANVKRRNARRWRGAVPMLRLIIKYN